MKLKGKFEKELLVYHDCTLLILYGKVQKISVPSLPNSIYSKINPNTELDFEFIKELKGSALAPIESNYKIQYKGKSETITVYLKLGKIKVARINWMRKEYFIQKDGFKIGFALLIIGIVIKSFIYNTPKTNNIDTIYENSRNVSASPKTNSKTLDSTTSGIMYNKDSISKVVSE